MGILTTGLPLSTQDGTQGPPERTWKRKYSKRRLTAENRQLLIASLFTPKTRRSEGEVKENEMNEPQEKDQVKEEEEASFSMPGVNLGQL